MRSWYLKIFLVHIFCIAVFFISISTAFNKTTNITFGDVTSEDENQFLNKTDFTASDLSNLNTLSKPIFFVGDVMLARHVEYLMSINGGDYPFQKLGFFKNEPSFVFGNFEAAVPKVHHKTPNFGFSFSVNPTYLNELKKAGFTHMSLANNHSFDFGLDEFINTKTELAKNDLVSFGEVSKLATTSFTLIDNGKVTIAVIGVFALDLAPSITELEDLLAKLPSKVDYKVAYVHWGTEYQETPSTSQRKFAQVLSSLGFNIVIGHHPHVTESVEMVNSTLVFYSLGNFIFDQYFSNQVQEGLVLKSDFDVNSVTIQLLPVTSIDSHAQPRLMNEWEKGTFLNNLAEISPEPLKSEIQSGLIFYSKTLATSTEMAMMGQ